MRLALLALLVLGCTGLPFAPDEPLAGPVPPRKEWLQGFREAEMCSGRHGDVTKIHWYVVPGNALAVEGDSAMLGYHDSGHNIYLAEGWAGHVWLARHESLHELGYGGNPHDPAVFMTRCHAAWGDLRETL